MSFISPSPAGQESLPTPFGAELATYRAALEEIKEIMQPSIDGVREGMLGSTALQGVESSRYQAEANKYLITEFAKHVLPRATRQGMGNTMRNSVIITADPLVAKVAWSRMLYTTYYSSSSHPHFVVGSTQHPTWKGHTKLLLSTPGFKVVNSPDESDCAPPNITTLTCRTDDYEKWREISDTRLTVDIPDAVLRNMFNYESKQYDPQTGATVVYEGHSPRLYWTGNRRKRELLHNGLRVNSISCDLGLRDIATIDPVAYDVARHFTFLAVDFGKTEELAGVFDEYNAKIQKTSKHNP